MGDHFSMIVVGSWRQGDDDPKVNSFTLWKKENTFCRRNGTHSAKTCKHWDFTSDVSKKRLDADKNHKTHTHQEMLKED